MEDGRFSFLAGHSYCVTFSSSTLIFEGEGGGLSYWFDNWTVDGPLAYLVDFLSQLGFRLRDILDKFGWNLSLSPLLCL